MLNTSQLNEGLTLISISWSRLHNSPNIPAEKSHIPIGNLKAGNIFHVCTMSQNFIFSYGSHDSQIVWTIFLFRVHNYFVFPFLELFALCTFSVVGRVFARLHYPPMVGSFAFLICKLSLVLEECTRRDCRIYEFYFQIRY